MSPAGLAVSDSVAAMERDGLTDRVLEVLGRIVIVMDPDVVRLPDAVALPDAVRLLDEVPLFDTVA